MSDFERGEPDEFEVIWRTGHTDRLVAHQVSLEGGDTFFRSGPETPQRVRFHAEIDGHWRLLLDALASDVLTIRNVTHVQERP